MATAPSDLSSSKFAGADGAADHVGQASVGVVAAAGELRTVPTPPMLSWTPAADRGFADGLVDIQRALAMLESMATVLLPTAAPFRVITESQRLLPARLSRAPTELPTGGV